jgi:cytochrome d ubiquinol oxidase subunit I
LDYALTVHRLQFAFTITFHYIFPQLTMGLALLLVVLKSLALITGNEHYNQAARFWAKIFGINFALGVVTGIPMEFQFGTNWARFSKAAGGVIGQTLAMEGMFSFFLESTFLGLFLFGEKRLGPIGHWLASVAVCVGAWLSGYFIIATDSWMQYPVGYSVDANGAISLTSISALLTNPWMVWQYSHNMTASVATASFVMSAVGAFYILTARAPKFGATFVHLGATLGLIAAVLLAMPTGDEQAEMVATHQPAAFAAMEGLFHTERGASLVIIGQPDVEKMRLDNPIELPRLLSFLTYQRWAAEVKGLDEFPRENWPDNIPLLYFSYHIMVGLGTIQIAITAIAALLLVFKRLTQSRAMLWILMLAFPIPYIATTAGWMTAEIGRQPWLIYGLMRTAEGTSAQVGSGSGMFTLMGFMGLYLLLGLLFVLMIARELQHGPEATA